MPSGDEAAAIATVPIETLRLEPASVAGLRRLGLKTIGALARLPRGELAARFGQAVLLRLDQAHGQVSETIAWPPPPIDWTEHERFAEPILTTEACLTVLDLLAARLCARLAAQRLGGRQFVATFQRVDGTLQQRAIATSLPVRDPAYLLRLLAERLDGLDPGFGIEAVSLAAPAIEASATEQQDFTRATPQGQQKLAQLIDALANRLSPHRLFRYAPRDSHIPERAVQTTSPLQTGIAWQDDPSAPRPIRLLSRPEPIEVTALLPDDPPMQFRWRGALHRVRAATGPERIAAEWWTIQEGGTRDYYQVEDAKGRPLLDVPQRRGVVCARVVWVGRRGASPPRPPLGHSPRPRSQRKAADAHRQPFFMNGVWGYAPAGVEGAEPLAFLPKHLLRNLRHVLALKPRAVEFVRARLTAAVPGCDRRRAHTGCRRSLHPASAAPGTNTAAPPPPAPDAAGW